MNNVTINRPKSLAERIREVSEGNVPEGYRLIVSLVKINTTDKDTAELIRSFVIDTYNIDLETFFHRTRHPEIVTIRRITAMFIRKYTNLSNGEVSHISGFSSSCGLNASIERLKELMFIDRDIKSRVNYIEEIILSNQSI